VGEVVLVGVGVVLVGVGVVLVGVGVVLVGVGVALGVVSVGGGVVSAGVGVGDGVGVGVGDGVLSTGGGVHVDLVMVFVSRVTAPLRAKSLPSTVAPVVAVMLVSARMVPRNLVPVPRVAELPTCQKTLQDCAPLIRVI
jgi:hypothetical protein